MLKGRRKVSKKVNQVASENGSYVKKIKIVKISHKNPIVPESSNVDFHATMKENRGEKTVCNIFLHGTEVNDNTTNEEGVEDEQNIYLINYVS